MWLVIPVSAFFRTHTGIPKKIHIPLALTESDLATRRVPRARYLPQQRVWLHLTCLQYRAKSFRASSQDSSLTRYARATVNRETKFHCDRSALFFRTRELPHVECTWRKWENGKSLYMASGRNSSKRIFKEMHYTKTAF